MCPTGAGWRLPIGDGDPAGRQQSGAKEIDTSAACKLIHELLHLRRFADHIPPSWPTGACRSEVQSRQDGAVLALCRDVVLERQFVAAVTHLHFDPRWPDVKLCQVTPKTTS